MPEHEPRIRELESKIDRLLVVFEEFAKRYKDHEMGQRAFRKNTNEALYGDGNGKRGVMVRLSLLEQTQSRMLKSMWLFATVAVGAIVSQILG